MIAFLNRYSYLFTSAIVMGAAWLVGARFGGIWPTVAVAGSGLGLALIQHRLRGGASTVSTLAELDDAAGERQPRLLFIYSDT